jgi:hypothetical protein
VLQLKELRTRDEGAKREAPPWKIGSHRLCHRPAAVDGQSRR